MEEYLRIILKKVIKKAFIPRLIKIGYILMSTSPRTAYSVVIITGMSGSGKSSALKAFEDLGFETIDNLPLSLLSAAIHVDKPSRPLAIDIDTRTRDFSADILIWEIDRLKKEDRVHLVFGFFECDNGVIENRYRETRRHHPLASAGSLQKGIVKERELLQNLKDKADFTLDTSLLTPPELRSYLRETFNLFSEKSFKVMLLSFAFPRGIPREADMVFDMRFLPNPFYQRDLKPLTGQAVPIQSYFEVEPEFHTFFQHLQGILTLILPRFKEEGRDYFIIAFGCTGGRHRSVFTAEQTGKWLAKKGYDMQIHHRDMEK